MAQAYTGISRHYNSAFFGFKVMSLNADVFPLPEPPEMAAELRRVLPGFRQIEWVEHTGSTNADLLQQARSNREHLGRPWLLGAHLQDHGRGRRGRTWVNRRGANLMFSCAFDVFLTPRLLPALSPLVGVAACKALRSLLSREARQHLLMKWPNDLMWKLAKLGGILVEVSRAGTASGAADHYLVIMGVGLNLSDGRALSQSLNRQIADWCEVAAFDPEAAALSPVTLVAAIAQSWMDAVNHVVRAGLDDFPQRFAEVDALAGQHLHIIDDKRVLHAGIACGVNELGQLLIRDPAGETPVVAGEVSVRPGG